MFLGLDLGTSGLRALLATVDGDILASAEQAYPVNHPHSGWSEQDPNDWVRALGAAAAELKANHPTEFAALKGIAISGHMHGATLLDENGQVLRPCILWNDTRSHVEAAQLDQTPGVRDLSGNIVFPGFTAPKLAWVRKHEPDTFARVAKVLLPKDYLGHWLTGKYISDMSDSAGTSWLDVGARDWSEELLSASGMRRDQMPDLVEGSDVAGRIRPDLAREWGVSEDVVIAGGGGDNAVAACGVGTLREGDGFVSLGTSGVLLAAKDSFAPKPGSAVHTFCHAIPGTWYQMGVILAATDSLNWLSRNLDHSAADLSAMVGNTISGPGSVRFLPYLSGERTPHNDSAIRGALIGLDIGTGQKELTQAVMEGVGFALRDSLEALKSTGTELNRLLAIGGGSQSRYWVEMLATLLNLPVDLPEKGEFGAALGAVRLAICAATGAAPETVMTAPKVAGTIEPRGDLTAAYDEAYQKFRATYPAIKAIQ
ncbi:xylulokinase [Qingshengfaniella alkalisoli]|uniref:Xylulose kinase n=1 Tax=Qingshengfaniella alkalisoli TaxID=2599296 RepID=A0A5B8IQH8_9RHOB|nr:xylulokinase [Qingshengfaniella alkalisoli]QDY68502.1 xylulokinase [Qingshengfaniella alkalisoli]